MKHLISKPNKFFHIFVKLGQKLFDFVLMRRTSTMYVSIGEQELSKRIQFRYEILLQMQYLICCRAMGKKNTRTFFVQLYYFETYNSVLRNVRNLLIIGIRIFQVAARSIYLFGF